MFRNINPAYVAVFAIPTVLLAVAVIFFAIGRSGAEAVSDVGATARADLISVNGDVIGTVNLVQGPGGVLIQVQAEMLAPGGHAFIVHEVGKCTPNFDAAGDHFDPESAGHGFIHSSWKGGEPLGAHGGDLPNIYAADDGTARADFFTDGISLDIGGTRSIFDPDGSAIVIYEKPDAYEEEESEAGERIACGVIQRS